MMGRTVDSCRRGVQFGERIGVYSRRVTSIFLSRSRTSNERVDHALVCRSEGVSMHMQIFPINILS